MYTKDEFNKLMTELETNFTSFLAKNQELETSVSIKVEPLTKSEEDSEKKPFPKKESEGKEEHKEEPEAKDSKPSENGEQKQAPENNSQEKPQGESKEQQQAPQDQQGQNPQDQAPQQNDGEGHDYDEEDLQHMHKMYASMSKGELRAHHDSVKQALDSHGMEKCGDMTMSKSENLEVKTEIVKDTAGTDLLKSEISAKDAEITDLKKSLGIATEFLEKLFSKKSAPAGKAVTNLEVIAKSEFTPEQKELSKDEVSRILNEKTRDPSLKKSDRDSINAFYLNGASINTISHLLK